MHMRLGRISILPDRPSVPSVRPKFFKSVLKIGPPHNHLLKPVIAAAPAASADPLQREDVEEPELTIQGASGNEVPTHWTEHLQHLRPGERRALRQYFPITARINALEPHMQKLTDDELKNYTPQLRERLSSQGENMNDILPEAFAVVREASIRVLGMRPYDVQLVGGIVLAQGQVAQMGTGEGKTLVASLPAYLYALTGKGVHIVTVNDYLAQRDAEWIGKVFEYLGLSVGVITSETSYADRVPRFAADITYITAHQLAFTYLQDNITASSDAVCLRRPFHYAIVDEVDSVLIDEARNPFIINLSGDLNTSQFWKVAIRVAQSLQPPTTQDYADFATSDVDDFARQRLEKSACDFLLDFRGQQVALRNSGMMKAVAGLLEEGGVVLAVEGGTGEIAAVLIEHLDGDGSINKNDDVDDVESRSSEEEGEMSSRVALSVRPTGSYLRTISSTTTEEEDEEPAISIYVENTTTNNNSTKTTSASSASSSSSSGETLLASTTTDIPTTLQKAGYTIIPPSLIASTPTLTRDIISAAVSAVLWQGGDTAWGRFITTALKALHLYRRDVEYIVKNNEILIIDTATGREKRASRWQHGLHQAIEAKESVDIKPEDFDQGRITYQVLFSYYDVLSGMTGTAVTEAEEFGEAYELRVVRVPPHRPSRRVDHLPSVMYNEEGWMGKIREMVQESTSTQRPILLGTSTVEESEQVLGIIQSISVQGTKLEGHEIAECRPLYRSLVLGGVPHYFQEAVQQRLWSDCVNILGRCIESGIVVMEAIPYLQYLLEGMVVELLRAQGFNTAEQQFAALGIDKVFEHVLERTTLRSSRIPVNVLNARPDRARNEAEIIAQAGLPSTITIATSMAGRGTDILLGGNPKGLTLIALKHFLLKYMVAQAVVKSGELAEWQSEAPLQGLSTAYSKEPDDKGALMLPVVLSRAYSEVKQALLRAKHGIGSSSGSTSSSTNKTASVLKDTKWVDIERADDAVHELALALETVEMERSLFLLYCKKNNIDTASLSLSTLLETTQQWITTQTSSSSSSSSSLWSTLQSSSSSTSPNSISLALHTYALLQWIWFDTECTKYATQVKAAGGLTVVITSLQPTRRSELQLRGRAGRQGNPGQTYLISSPDDPKLKQLLRHDQQAAFWNAIDKFLESSGGPLEEVPYWGVAPTIKATMSNYEQSLQQGRDMTRKYDEIIDGYRRHVYGLRKTVVAGGQGARSALLTRYIGDFAAALVDHYTTIGSGGIGSSSVDSIGKERKRMGVKKWDIEGLMRAVHAVVNVPVNAAGVGFDLDMIDPDIAFPSTASDNSSTNGDDASTTNNNNKTNNDGSETQIRVLMLGSNSNNPDIMFTMINLRPVQTAAALYDALTSKPREVGSIPLPSIDSIVLPGSSSIRQRKNKYLAREESISGSSSGSGTTNRREVELLTAWVAELLMVVYEYKKQAIQASHTTTHPTKTVLQSQSAVRVWEKHLLITCLDSLWADFLQDIQLLQQASQSRAFSQLDPFDEFKLEASELFSRLLNNFRRQAVVGAMGGVKLGSVRLKEDDVRDEVVRELKRREVEWVIKRYKELVGSDFVVVSGDGSSGGGVVVDNSSTTSRNSSSTNNTSTSNKVDGASSSSNSNDSDDIDEAENMLFGKVAMKAFGLDVGVFGGTDSDSGDKDRATNDEEDV